LKGYDDVKVGEYAVLTVADSGPGILSDDLERIFEPFYTKKVMGRSGTGLGLTVVWNVMQDHNGYIHVSADESGSAFELYFPVTREEIWKKDTAWSVEDCMGDGETILVVDDVENQRDICCKMLEIIGYKPFSVSSGESAVDYLKDHSVDLVLLDMIMDPGINGRETYERIIKIHPGQKAVIVSGFAATNDVLEAQRLGAGRYLKKPVQIDKLGMAIKETLMK
jgi:CheY-like chemotaxis protein